MRNHFAVFAAVALMAGSSAGCSALQSAPETPGQQTAASEWVGKTRGEVVKKLGEPISAVPVDTTGGEMLFYAHYVFESAPGGFIIKATPVN
jgi:outer membrane protein assembly factor BamE (lipoprotein component of BamABCDE complex)